MQEIEFEFKRQGRSVGERVEVLDLSKLEHS